MSGMTVFSRLESDKAKNVRLVNLHIRKVMMDVTSSEFLLCEVVAGGGTLWRKTLTEAFSSPLVTDDVADRVFLFFCAAVQARFGAQSQLNGVSGEAFQSEHMDAALIAGEFLDKCEPTAPPPSMAEIAKSWRIDDASSDAAKRAEYAETGMHPQEALDKLVALDQDAEVKH
ncbi:MAG: hypothetical protein ACYC2H_01345 [Thermoplasmatota archaeon]